MEFLKIWEIILRRKKVIIYVFLVFFITAVIGTHLIPSTYEVKARLLVGISEALPSLMSTLGLTSAQTSSDEYDTEIALAMVRPLLETLISQLKLKDRSGDPMEYDKLVEWGLYNKIRPQPYLEVDQYEDSDILEIISTSHDPTEAVNMSNTLAKLYMNDVIERTRNEFKGARTFIESQVRKAQEDYYASLIAFKDFRLETGIVDLDTTTEKLIDKVESLKGSYEENEKAIAELEKEIVKSEEQLKKREMFRKDSKEFVLSDQLKQLQSKINELLIDISGREVLIREDHPEYKQLEKELGKVRELIKNEAKVVFNSEKLSIDPIYDKLTQTVVDDYIQKELAVLKMSVLQRYIDKYQRELMQIPVVTVEHSKLSLALSVSKDMYEKMLEFLVHVGVAESITLSSIKLVEAAVVPTKPSFPKKPLGYALGLVFGVFWGLAVAFFLEYIDKTIKSPEEAKQIESALFLGTIASADSLESKTIIGDMDAVSPIVESFRTVRNNISFAYGADPVRSFVVTSCVHAEGKSSVASNLAISFSMKNKKVIVVDADLRTPALHRFFSLSGEKGIAQVLTGELHLEAAIAHTGIENLDVLPGGGPAASDPSRLIESPRFKEVITSLEELYDIVVIDTPPVTDVNDPIIIGMSSDGVLCVLESSRVTFSMFEDMRQRMQQAGLKLVGIVLNKFEKPDFQIVQVIALIKNWWAARKDIR